MFQKYRNISPVFRGFVFICGAVNRQTYGRQISARGDSWEGCISFLLNRGLLSKIKRLRYGFGRWYFHQCIDILTINIAIQFSIKSLYHHNLCSWSWEYGQIFCISHLVILPHKANVMSIIHSPFSQNG